MQTSAHYNAVAQRPPNKHVWQQRRIEHNHVKKKLMLWVAARMPHAPTATCDLACGRGGDLGKIANVFPCTTHDCVDSSKDSIAELERRAKELHIQVNAFCSDVLQYTMPTQKYDVVCMNFALHYFTTTQQTIHKLLRNVANGLKPHGFFFGTCVDWRTLYHTNNACFNVQPQTLKNIENQPWGRTYRFTLPGCVNTDECVVHFPSLVAEAHKCGLNLVKHRGFNGFIQESINNACEPCTPACAHVNHNFIVFAFQKEDANTM